MSRFSRGELKASEPPRSARFTVALRKAREHISLLENHNVTAERFARQIGISVEQYRKYELGSIPPREVFQRLCEVLKPHFEIIENLRTQYKSVSTENTLEVIPFHAQSGQVDEWIHKTTGRLLVAYETGSLSDAVTIAQHSWPYALRYGNDIAELAALATMVSRTYSQLNQHLQALSATDQLMQKANQAHSRSEANAARLARLTYTTRYLGASGSSAAHLFLSFINDIKGNRRAARDGGDDQVTLNAAYRGIVIALTDRHGEENSLLLQDIRSAFEESNDGFSEWPLISANMLAQARVEAVVGDPEMALHAFASAVDHRSGFVDHAFVARTQILALIRMGRYEQACMKSRYWEQECLQRHMGHKAKLFRELAIIATRSK